MEVRISPETSVGAQTARRCVPEPRAVRSARYYAPNLESIFRCWYLSKYTENFTAKVEFSLVIN
jgi:hypothetical protein